MLARAVGSTHLVATGFNPLTKKTTPSPWSAVSTIPI